MSQLPPASQVPDTGTPGPQSPPPAGPPPVAGLAIAALVLGLLGMCVPLIGVAALVLGIIAINQIDNPARHRGGRGIAMAGAILGGIGVVFNLLIIPFLALMIGILLPALGAARSTAMQMQSNSQLRGIHQEMYLYAQGNGGYFPGLDTLGEPADLSAAGRLFLLVDGNYVTPEYLISPVEDGAQPWAGGAFNEQHYSYALLSIAAAGGRRAEWNELSFNAQAIMLSDRNTGVAAAPASLYTGTPGDWRGGVVYNDNHAETLTQPFVDTNYAGTQNLDDELFTAAGADDALLIHTGE